MTINEALVWRGTLLARTAELVELRNANSHTTTRRFGMAADKSETTTPLYDVKKLDKMIGVLHKNLRELDLRLKATNAITEVVGYVHDDSVLGEIE